MRYLLATSDYWPKRGGVAQYYHSLKTNWPDSSELVVMSEHSELFGRFWPYWMRGALEIVSRYKRQEFTHLLVGQILPIGNMALVANLFQRIPYTVILHGMDYSLAIRNPLKRYLCRLILSRAEKIVCANTYLASLLRRDFGGTIGAKIFILNPGVEPVTQSNVDVRSKYGLNDKKIIFSLGRLVQRKGFDYSILAFLEISKERDDVVYVLAGDGPDRLQLEKLAGDSKKILFLGDIGDEDKNAWLKCCDFFVMTSRDIDGDFEGFGIVYLEANMFSKAVLAGNSGGVSDAVEDGVNGLLCNPQDIADIREKMIVLLDDPKLCEKLGKKGSERALHDFNWKTQARRLNELLEKI